MINFIQYKTKNEIKTAHLLGFLPIFIDIDGHYFFNIFGIRFNIKHNYETLFKEIKSTGITESKRDTQLIVS